MQTLDYKPPRESPRGISGLWLGVTVVLTSLPLSTFALLAVSAFVEAIRAGGRANPTAYRFDVATFPIATAAFRGMQFAVPISLLAAVLLALAGPTRMHRRLVFAIFLTSLVFWIIVLVADPFGLSAWMFD